MKIRVTKASGEVLGYMVAKCEGVTILPKKRGGHFVTLNKGETVLLRYSTTWAQAGPIIERENISLAGKDPLHDCWAAMTQYGTHKHEGHTPLIAAMRCYVASKLGDEVDIPEGIL